MRTAWSIVKVNLSYESAKNHLMNCHSDKNQQE